jgi:hypothetical protein
MGDGGADIKFSMEAVSALTFPKAYLLDGVCHWASELRMCVSWKLPALERGGQVKAPWGPGWLAESWRGVNWRFIYPLRCQGQLARELSYGYLQMPKSWQIVGSGPRTTDLCTATINRPVSLNGSSEELKWLRKPGRALLLECQRAALWISLLCFHQHGWSQTEMTDKRVGWVGDRPKIITVLRVWTSQLVWISTLKFISSVRCEVFWALHCPLSLGKGHFTVPLSFLLMPRMPDLAKGLTGLAVPSGSFFWSDLPWWLRRQDTASRTVFHVSSWGWGFMKQHCSDSYPKVIITAKQVINAPYVEYYASIKKNLLSLYLLTSRASHGILSKKRTWRLCSMSIEE